MAFVPSDYELYLFHEGNLFRSYEMLGAHSVEFEGLKGVRFSVWAPRAARVRVVGDFNGWRGKEHEMHRLNTSGIWSLFIPEAKEGHLYKYEIHTPGGEVFLKADPYAFSSEYRPGTASRIYSLKGYQWNDGPWQQRKEKNPIYNRPLLIYEVHLGSWKRKKTGAFYTYRELAEKLVEYVSSMGFTHIELLPLVEHPHDGSWGYQATGYYSVTSRYGTPHDFMYFVDRCHQKGIGVILDWVPGHFCKDAHGLREFNGEPLYEAGDRRRSESAEWDTLYFDLGKPEVQSFLISNALFWLEVYHIDGLRVDAVASMLYLDYGKKGGDWLPNKYGGRENLEAITFCKKLNEGVFRRFPNALMIAEESTQWPLVSRPTYLGGLGFNYKWNMGWMNDILRYMEMDPVHRKWHHNLLTFSFWYAYAENFILPLSHDEVVHGKRALLAKMPGDYWQKFANLRLLYGYMLVHPGKKLLFMGGEFGQYGEWKEWGQLDWHLLKEDMHAKLHHYFREINCFYRNKRQLWELDHEEAGFEWISPHDYRQSVVAFMRKGKKGKDFLIAVGNFTPVIYEGYRIGVPYTGSYGEIFNSDREEYGGSGQSNGDDLLASDFAWHNQPCSLEIKIPPLALVVLEKK